MTVKEMLAQMMSVFWASDVIGLVIQKYPANMHF